MGVLAFFSPYKLAIEIALIGSLAAGAVFGVHQFLEHERQIGRDEVQGKWDAQTAKDIAAARAREADLIKQRDDAITNGAKRDETIRTLASAAGASSVGLRDSVAAAVGRSVSSATADALRDTTRTLGGILVECEGRRRGVAETAERLNSEKQTLIDAWPKPKATP